MKIYRNRTRV